MFYFYNRGASVMGYPFVSKFCGSSCMNVKFTDSGLSYERVVRETKETEHLFEVESNTRYDIETFNNIISTCDEVTSFALLPRDLGKYPTEALRAILDFNTNSVLDYDMPDDIELYQELTGSCLSRSSPCAATSGLSGVLPFAPVLSRHSLAEVRSPLTGCEFLTEVTASVRVWRLQILSFGLRVACHSSR